MGVLGSGVEHYKKAYQLLMCVCVGAKTSSHDHMPMISNVGICRGGTGSRENASGMGGGGWFQMQGGYMYSTLNITPTWSYGPATLHASACQHMALAHVDHSPTSN